MTNILVNFKRPAVICMLLCLLFFFFHYLTFPIVHSYEGEKVKQGQTQNGTAHDDDTKDDDKTKDDEGDKTDQGDGNKENG